MVVLRQNEQDNTLVKVTVLTTSATLLKEKVGMAVLPGEEGELGILPAHTPIVVALKPGLLKLYTQRHDPSPTRTLMLETPGIAMMEQGNTCTIVLDDTPNK